jgi:putative transposase
MDYRYGSHTVYKIEYHFVWSTKYRYQMLRGEVGLRVRDLIMRRIKERSSSKLFNEYPHLKKRYWGRHFWARGYFCATVGEMTEEMIKNYLAHHFEPRENDDFKIEPN